jgi:hypothetical protein
MALPVAHEYACLMVRGYKTAETKTTAHLKKMGGQYVVLYASQLPAAGTLSEAMLLHRGHLAKCDDTEFVTLGGLVVGPKPFGTKGL